MYLKWVFGKKKNDKGDEYILDEITVSEVWDPHNDDWGKRGGFNFTNEECCLRWMSRGDTLYEVEIPEDGEVVEVVNSKTPGGIFIANKIILKNPINISSKLLFDYYEKSKLPLKTYFECIGLLAARGYYDLCIKIINDKVSDMNIDEAILEFNESIKPWHEVDYQCYNKVKEELLKKKK